MIYLILITGANQTQSGLLSDLFERHLVRSEDTLENIHHFLRSTLVSALGRENLDFLEDEEDVQESTTYPALNKANFHVFYKSKNSGNY